MPRLKKQIKFLLTSVTLLVTLLCTYIFTLAQINQDNMHLLWFCSEFPMIWMPWTANFVHLELPHLINNLIGFVLCGSVLEYKIGKLNFIQLIMGTGAGAMACQVLFDMAVLNIGGGIYFGLSAISYGVITGLFLFLLLESIYNPNFDDISKGFETICTIFMSSCIILYCLITEILQFSIHVFTILNPDLNLERSFIAYLAHIIGMLIGMLYTYIIFMIMKNNNNNHNKEC